MGKDWRETLKSAFISSDSKKGGSQGKHSKDILIGGGGCLTDLRYNRGRWSRWLQGTGERWQGVEVIEETKDP